MQKNVLVSGANGHLGMHVVDAFLKSGHQVNAIVRRKENEISNVHYYEADLTDETATHKAVEKIIAEKKQIHAAVLASGGFAMGDLFNTTSQDIDKMIALNFKTAFHLIKPLFEHMMEHGTGTIVLIASTSAVNPGTGSYAVAYTLSKSMLLTLAAMLNNEGKQKQISTHVIVPGIIDTPANREAMPTADFSSWNNPKVIAEKIKNLCEQTFDSKGAYIHTF